MLRTLDLIAAGLILLVGLAHVVVASAVFFDPSERGVWFLSAGFFGLTTGLANLARNRAAAPSRWLAAAALSGAAGVVAVGALLAAADGFLLSSPQAIVAMVAGLILAVFSARDLLGGRRR